MSVGITLLGASYSDVSGVSLPKTGGGTVTFPEVSDTTAAAADVASGKYFYTSAGVRTQGTASGGGGSNAIRVGRWALDTLMVEDEGYTIPAYSTSTKTVRTASYMVSSSTSTVDLDIENYSYCLLIYGLVYPIYSGNTRSSGYFAYNMYVAKYEPVYVKGGTIQFDGATYTNTFSLNDAYSENLKIYYTSSSALTYSTSNYGVYITATSQDFSAANKTLKPRFPQVSWRGNGSYYSQTAWNATTDIRVQIIGELWKAEEAKFDAAHFGYHDMTSHIIECAKSANRTLT